MHEITIFISSEILCESVYLYFDSAVIFAMVKNEVSTAGIDQTFVVSTSEDYERSSERSPLLGPVSICCKTQKILVP